MLPPGCPFGAAEHSPASVAHGMAARQVPASTCPAEYMKARLRAEQCPPRAYNRTGWITRTEARIREYISFDSHKYYTLMEREDIQTQVARQRRIKHAPDAIRAALRGGEADTPVAVEATGNWDWIVSEIEQAVLFALAIWVTIRFFGDL